MGSFYFNTSFTLLHFITLYIITLHTDDKESEASNNPTQETWRTHLINTLDSLRPLS